MKKKEKTKTDQKSPLAKKGTSKREPERNSAQDVVDACPEQNKDCENCKRIYCPEEQ
jgi:hypothetical protein